MFWACARLRSPRLGFAGLDIRMASSVITPDPIWLEIAEAARLRALAGSALAAALIVCVVVIAVSAVAWGAHRVGWLRMGEGALANVGRAVLGAVVLGSLSGIVGWSSGLI